MATMRTDETWHRLREWTNGQAPSERLAAQILAHEGFMALDPSHPLGGPDGGKDAMCRWNGKPWIMAVYFPRGQPTNAAIRKKFVADARAAAKHLPEGMAFVTNQELVLAQRETLRDASPIAVEFFHLERIATILDMPAMADVRSQFLAIPKEAVPTIHLGGQGGTAPGAGGGGGGALGKNARGGPGGKGGSVTYAGSPAAAPGAGGGGAGAEGDNAQGGGGGGGGDGGDGGERVQRVITGDLLAAMHRMEFRVGEGGKYGGPGSDSILNIVSGDGEVLESVVARGGKAGKSHRRDLSVVWSLMKMWRTACALLPCYSPIAFTERMGCSI